MSKVYFTKEITPESIVKMYDILGVELKGRVAIKIHSGEEGNQNFIGPEFIKPICEHVNGTIVECNTAYDGARTNNEDHDKLMESHGWTKYFDVDIMDRDGSITLDIPNGKVIKENYVGAHIDNYDSVLVIAHGKGHPMGGFGGQLKQLSIGFASREGKAYIHSGGKLKDANIVWENHAEQNAFLEAMADAAGSIVEKFEGNIAYITILKNLSVDCDCCAVAEDPCMKDIGILAGTDPIAMDQAFMDLVMSSNDPGKEHFMQRVNSRNGIHVIEAADALKYGSREYELVNVD